MRPTQAISLLLVAALLGTTVLALAPSAAACSILVTPTKCATTIYYHERDFVLDKATSLQGTVSDAVGDFEGTYETTRATAEAAAGPAGEWVFDAPTQVVACAPAELPGLDYDPGPAVAGNLAYLEMQQAAAQAFAAGAPVNPFQAGAAFIDAAYGNTVWVFQSWDSNVFQPLLIETAEEVSAQLTGPQTIPQLGVPEAPDGDVAAELTAQVAGSQGNLSCASSIELPPL